MGKKRNVMEKKKNLQQKISKGCQQRIDYVKKSMLSIGGAKKIILRKEKKKKEKRTNLLKENLKKLTRSLKKKKTNLLKENLKKLTRSLKKRKIGLSTKHYQHKKQL